MLCAAVAETTAICRRKGGLKLPRVVAAAAAAETAAGGTRDLLTSRAAEAEIGTAVMFAPDRTKIARTALTAVMAPGHPTVATTIHRVNEVVRTDQPLLIGVTTTMAATKKVCSAQNAAKGATEAAEDVATALRAPVKCCSTSCSNGSATANKPARPAMGGAETVVVARAEIVHWTHHLQRTKPRLKTTTRGGGGSQIGSGLRRLLQKLRLRKVPSALPPYWPYPAMKTKAKRVAEASETRSGAIEFTIRRRQS